MTLSVRSSKNHGSASKVFEDVKILRKVPIAYFKLSAIS